MSFLKILKQITLKNKRTPRIQQEKRGTEEFCQKTAPVSQESRLYFKINGYTKSYSKTTSFVPSIQVSTLLV